jgi:actin-related protein
MPLRKKQPQSIPQQLLHQLKQNSKKYLKKESETCRQKSSRQISQNLLDRLAGSDQVLTSETTVIHNFSKEIKVKNIEIKQLNKKVVSDQKNNLPISKKKVAKQPILDVQSPQIISTQNEYVGNISAPKIFYESSSIILPDAENNHNNNKNTNISLEPHFIVHRLGDVYTGKRCLMNHIGIDIGTKTVVVAYRGEKEIEYLSEINGYWPFERSNPFVEQMLDDPNKKRSDGTQRPARWIKLGDAAIVLGRDAEELAYAKNDTLLRPMAEGGITQDEQAMTVLAAIVQGLIEMVEKDCGNFHDEGVKICYCTTAPAINKENNIDYHERVVNMIIGGYESAVPLSYSSIKESHAIVLDMDEGGEGTGIGISWGAGTVTVSYVKYGMEIYSFCWVGAGDWIDNQVAMRHGYVADTPKTMKKKSKETPTTIAKRKQTVDLTPGKMADDRLDMDIILHYDLLIDNVVFGIIQGFVENESEARIEEAINVYMAGGTSSPKGFEERVATRFEENETPFNIGKIIKSDKPLFCVATGCLKAAEFGIAD